MWKGDRRFLMKRLILKDFTIRYRNMSLGVFWSLLNPLVMMALWTFVFGTVFQKAAPNFGLFVLCGMIPYNFFVVATNVGTTSLLDNAGLVKRVAIPLEVVPLATVLSACIHLAIQVLLLLVFALLSGFGITKYWLWLPLIWFLEIMLVSGLVLVTSSLNVFIRDTRYLVESANVALLWLVPVFYPFTIIPERFQALVHYNPVAALVFAMRDVVLEGKSPASSLIWKLVAVSVSMFFFGRFFFGRLKNRFYGRL
jgi:lipopolysaccharide transport system permease protein